MKDIRGNKKRVSRRDFLGFAWVASLLGLVGQTGVALFSFFKPRIELGTFGARINVGQANEFNPGTVSYVQKGRLYISRLEDGGFLALWHRWTHLGCTVPWREEEGLFHCPCHSSVFTPVGEVLSGPAPRPMDIFQIQVVDGAVFVDTSTPIQRESFIPSQVTYI